MGDEGSEDDDEDEDEDDGKDMKSIDAGFAMCFVI